MEVKHANNWVNLNLVGTFIGINLRNRVMRKILLETLSTKNKNVGILALAVMVQLVGNLPVH